MLRIPSMVKVKNAIIPVQGKSFGPVKFIRSSPTSRKGSYIFPITGKLEDFILINCNDKISSLR